MRQEDVLEPEHRPLLGSTERTNSRKRLTLPPPRWLDAVPGSGSQMLVGQSPVASSDALISYSCSSSVKRLAGCE